MFKNKYLDQKALHVVVLIDSGIDTTKGNLNNNVMKSIGLSINKEGYIVEESQNNILYEHGTAIALIIKYFYPNVSFISINIFNDKLSTDGRVLLYAIKKALLFKPQIIHLSLGTTRKIYIPSLMLLTNMAKKNNTLIVAAADNMGNKSYPAYLKNVIGVKAHSDTNFSGLMYFNKFFMAPINAYNIPGIEELKFKDIKGTSISAAYMTGYIMQYINSMNNNFNYIIKLLKQEATLNYERRMANE